MIKRATRHGRAFWRIILATGFTFPMLGAVCCGALALPLPASADDIVILKSSDILLYRQAVSGFKAELDSGYVVNEYDVGGDVRRGRHLAETLRASNPKLVVAVGLKATLAARLEIVDVPVIYCMVFDAAKHDLTASNFMGVTLHIPAEKQIKAIREFLPKAKRLGLLFDPEKTPGLVAEAKRAAQKAGIAVIESPVTSQKQVPQMLRQLLPTIDAVWLVPDSTVIPDEESLRFILGTALDQAKPVIGFSSEFARNGALLALSVAPDDIGKQVAHLADRIMKHEVTPSGMTVAPDRLRVAINLKSANFLGIPMPPDIVNRAQEVY